MLSVCMTWYNLIMLACESLLMISISLEIFFTLSASPMLKATIAPYKYPRSVVYTDALPKTETGKIQRFRLREGAS